MSTENRESPRDVAERLLSEGRLLEAGQAYEQALSQDPADAAAWFGLGTARANLGEFARAAAAFQEVIALNPDSAAAHFNKGNAEAARGELEQALESFRRAAAIDPQPQVNNNLGTTLAALGRLAEAASLFETMIEADPDVESTHVNYCQALAKLEKWKEAISACHAGLERHCNSTPLLKILANAWIAARVPANSISCLERVTQLDPADSEALKLLANLYASAGELSKAEAHFHAALRQHADDLEVYNNLGEICRKRGAVAAALAYQQRALDLDPSLTDTHSNHLLTMLYSTEFEPADIRRAAREWGDRHTASIRPLPQRVPVAKDRLRIGYLSGSFHNHPVGIVLEPILIAHDRAAFDVLCYAHQEHHDGRLKRVKAAADAWTDVNAMSDDELAKKIAQDQVDILVDLCGHTWPNRLPALARKPAPVQVTWFGYASTTGLAAMDYILADEWIIPPAEEAAYVEKVERLPKHHVCFRPPELDLEPGPGPKADQPITYGSFNNLAKMAPAVYDLWSEIMRATKNTRLFLKTGSLGDESLRSAILEEFAGRGVAADRIRLEGHSPRAELLAAYREIDLCLDPFPFNGAVTSLEALWMGVPVLNLKGNRFAARAGESLLRGVGLDELVAESTETYRDTAIELAENKSRLERLRTGLRERLENSALCDDKQFTRDLESVYRRIWQRAVG